MLLALQPIAHRHCTKNTAENEPRLILLIMFRALFRALRWHETGGEPVCPACGCVAVYEFKTRPPSSARFAASSSHQRHNLCEGPADSSGRQSLPALGGVAASVEVRSPLV